MQTCDAGGAGVILHALPGLGIIKRVDNQVRILQKRACALRVQFLADRLNFQATRPEQMIAQRLDLPDADL